MYVSGVTQRILMGQSWKEADKQQFKKIIEEKPLIIFLVVKYLEQLDYDKNPLKDKKFCKFIEKILKGIEEKIEQKYS